MRLALARQALGLELGLHRLGLGLLGRGLGACRIGLALTPRDIGFVRLLAQVGRLAALASACASRRLRLVMSTATTTIAITTTTATMIQMMVLVSTVNRLLEFGMAPAKRVHSIGGNALPNDRGCC